MFPGERALEKHPRGQEHCVSPRPRATSAAVFGGGREVWRLEWGRSERKEELESSSDRRNVKVNCGRGTRSRSPPGGRSNKLKQEGSV